MHITLTQSMLRKASQVLTELICTPRNRRSEIIIKISNNYNQIIIEHECRRKDDLTDKPNAEQYGIDIINETFDKIIKPIFFKFPVTAFEDKYLKKYLLNMFNSLSSITINTEDTYFSLESKIQNIETLDYKNVSDEFISFINNSPRLYQIKTIDILKPLEKISKQVASPEQSSEYNHIALIGRNENEADLIGGFHDIYSQYTVPLNYVPPVAIIFQPLPVIAFLNNNLSNVNIGYTDKYLVLKNGNSTRYFFNQDYLSLKKVSINNQPSYFGNYKSLRSIRKGLKQQQKTVSITANNNLSEITVKNKDKNIISKIDSIKGVCSKKDYSKQTLKSSIADLDLSSRNIDNSISTPKIKGDTKGIIEIRTYDSINKISPVKIEIPQLYETIEIRAAVMNYNEAIHTKHKYILLNFLDFSKKIWQNPELFNEIKDSKLADKDILIDLGAYTYEFNKLKQQRVKSDETFYKESAVRFINTCGCNVTCVTSFDWYSNSLAYNIAFYEKLIKEVPKEKIIYVFHIGESLDLFRQFLIEYRPMRIGFGGSPKNSHFDRIIFARELFRILKDVYGNDFNKLWTHGFGMNSTSFDGTNPEGLLHRFPFVSADSSTWAQFAYRRLFTTPFGEFSVEEKSPYFWKRSQYKEQITKFVNSLPIITKDCKEARPITIDELTNSKPNLKYVDRFNLEFLSYLSRGNLHRIGYMKEQKEFIPEEQLLKMPHYYYEGMETLTAVERFQPIFNNQVFKRGEL